MNHLELLNLNHLILVILILAYIIYKQITLRAVKPSKYIIFPIILLYITIGEITSLHLDMYKELAPILLLLSIGLISGIASGMLTKIFTGKDGILYQKGGIAAAILLLFIIPIRIMLRHSIAAIPGGAILQASGASYLIMLSSHFISRSLTIIIRCPQIWSLYLQHRSNRRTRRKQA
jgi:hypothetical protein